MRNNSEEEGGPSGGGEKGLDSGSVRKVEPMACPNGSDVDYPREGRKEEVGEREGTTFGSHHCLMALKL